MNKIKVFCVLAFLAFGVVALFTSSPLAPGVEAYSSGPPPGFTGGGGETTCAACHFSLSGPGQFTISAPATYVPGQTYQIHVQHSTTDTTRLRWGFQLTCLTAAQAETAAGTFANLSGFTQILTANDLFYIEHTTSGTFAGQSGGAQWSFNWTAPPTDVGPVTFYSAGNEANNDGTDNGDQIYTASSTANAATATPTATSTNTPTSTPTNTPTATPTAAPAVSGTVTYGNAIPAATRPVSNVLISAAGSPSFSTVTGAGTGQYSLSGFGSGSYSVTPSKSGAVNAAITSFDAARIAQHVAGVNPLTGNALVAADVSGGGGVTSFDAGLVARFVAGVPPPPTNLSGNWIFLPANRNYASVTTNITGQDYSALLMGDVSGNWQDSGTRPASEISDSGGPERGTSIIAPRLVTSADSDVIIPISVDRAADKGIIAYEFDLRYDPAVIQPQADPVDLARTVSSKLSVVVNAEEAGLLRVVVYGPQPIDSDGILANLRFTAVGAPGSVTPLKWERFMLNEDPETTATDGQVELSRAAASDDNVAPGADMAS